jgi:hypothetical protein
MSTPTSARFPDTQAAWIANQLGEGNDGLFRVCDHVMAWYRKPLVAYCRAVGLGAALRTEPDDIVNGFFASRLSEPDYLRSWQSSGFRLRRWLRNGINLFVREELRKQLRTEHIDPDDPEADASTEDPEAVDAFERAWAEAALEGAISVTKASLTAAGHLEDWELFWTVRVRGVPYEAVVEERRITIPQARHKVFEVAERLRDALREVLLRDGATPDQISSDIRAMMKAFHYGCHNG